MVRSRVQYLLEIGGDIRETMGFVRRDGQMFHNKLLVTGYDCVYTCKPRS